MPAHISRTHEQLIGVTTSASVHLIFGLLLWSGGDANRNTGTSGFYSSATSGVFVEARFVQRTLKPPQSLTIEPLPSTQRSQASIAPKLIDARPGIPATSADFHLNEGVANSSGANEVHHPIDANSASSGDGLEIEYVAALRSAIDTALKRSGHVLSATCELALELRPGGEVASALSTDCALTTGERQALEAAALMAQPLPYAGYETVFSSTRRIDFQPPPAAVFLDSE